jgi:hypothetical protein
MFKTNDKETKKNIKTTLLVLAGVIIWLTIQFFPEFPMKM